MNQLVLDEVLGLAVPTRVYTYATAVAQVAFSFKALVSGHGVDRSVEKHCHDHRTLVLFLNAAERENARQFWGIVFGQLLGYGHHE